MKNKTNQNIEICKQHQNGKQDDSYRHGEKLSYLFIILILFTFLLKNYLNYLKKEKNKNKYRIYKANSTSELMPQTATELSLNSLLKILLKKILDIPYHGIGLKPEWSRG